jgi:hypothetical protein
VRGASRRGQGSIRSPCVSAKPIFGVIRRHAPNFGADGGGFRHAGIRNS